MADNELWSQQITVADAFRVMQFHLASHNDLIGSSDAIGWFFGHVTDGNDPAHKRQWLGAVSEMQSEDAH